MAVWFSVDVSTNFLPGGIVYNLYFCSLIKGQPMAAYIIVDVEIQNPTEYEDYKKLTTSTVPLYDGKFIVRGGATETLEGEWYPERIVVLEFSTVERAKEWWSSKEYAEAKSIRQRTAKTKMIVVEGAPNPKESKASAF